MLNDDEVVFIVVDDRDKRLGPVQWPGELRSGQDIEVKIKGRFRLFRVAFVRPAGRGRFVHVVAPPTLWL